MDVLAGAGVSVLMSTRTHGERTTAARCGKPSGMATTQTALTSSRSSQPCLQTAARLPKPVGNMLRAHSEGVDYPARVIQRCRHHGISPWISLRMNDVHENDNLDHPFHSAALAQAGVVPARSSRLLRPRWTTPMRKCGITTGR